MNHPHARRLASLASFLAVLLIHPASAHAFQNPASGQFFTVNEPITHEKIRQIQLAAKQLVDRAAATEQGIPPILVFEFRGGDARGTSDFGA